MRASLFVLFSFFAVALFRSEELNAAPAEVGFTDCGVYLPCWSGPYDFGVLAPGETKSKEINFNTSIFPHFFDVSPTRRDRVELGPYSLTGGIVAGTNYSSYGWDITATPTGWNVSVTNVGPDTFGIYAPVIALSSYYRWAETTLINGRYEVTVANEIFFELDLFKFTPASQVVVPLPGALPLFASVLAGLGVFGWQQRRR